jgi:hypothetical protein
MLDHEPANVRVGVRLVTEADERIGGCKSSLKLPKMMQEGCLAVDE